MRIFKEEQRFTQTWLIVVLAISLIVSTSIMIKEYSKDNSTLSTTEFVLVLFGTISAPLIIFFFKLKTRIDEIGIHYQFIPFHFSKKTIVWSDIKSAYTRKYDAITEFGGWGLKSKVIWRKSRGVSYSVSGNIGLQLELISGKKILIGTQKQYEVDTVINTYKNKIQ
ncbi:MAG: hypothetical protein HWD85_02065 [Flavobacteriaceae bacterium]|nr:hypothetical protein [Flavobacteriaceae bacterium]